MCFEYGQSSGGGERSTGVRIPASAFDFEFTIAVIGIAEAKTSHCSAAGKTFFARIMLVHEFHKAEQYTYESSVQHAEFSFRI